MKSWYHLAFVIWSWNRASRLDANPCRQEKINLPGRSEFPISGGLLTSMHCNTRNFPIHRNTHLVNSPHNLTLKTCRFECGTNKHPKRSTRMSRGPVALFQGGPLRILYSNTTYTTSCSHHQTQRLKSSKQATWKWRVYNRMPIPQANVDVKCRS